jgi:calreticulin
MKLLLLALAALSVSAHIYFQETFDDSYESRWVVSDWKKSSGTAGTWKHTAGDWYGDAEKDKGIQTSQDARFYAISSKLKKPFSNQGKDLVLQFTVKHTQKIDCGGGYIKLLGSDIDQKEFNGETPYGIMFGPDVCGTTTKRVHVIFTYKGKNLLTKKTIPCETYQLTHTYTLIVHPDNTYEVRIDGEKKESGNLQDDWDFLPPKEIKDPSKSKPKDWVDDAKMDDPNDKKPADWDKIPAKIADPEAEKPDDWDDEADGEWEAPQIDNPEYKGEWKPKKVPNPDYKGPWEHPMIANPDYVEDKNLYVQNDIGAVGIEIWQVKAGSIFDNIIVTDDVKEAEKFAKDTFGSKSKEAEKSMFEEHEKKERDAQEAARKKEEEARKAKESEEEDEDDEDDDDKQKDEL